jgi:hypothetical protein
MEQLSANPSGDQARPDGGYPAIKTRTAESGRGGRGGFEGGGACDWQGANSSLFVLRHHRGLGSRKKRGLERDENGSER